MNGNVMQTNRLLSEMLEPVTKAFSRDVAEAFVNLKGSERVQTRIGELAEKCNRGEITATEQAEYRSCVQVIDLISLLQAKARTWLDSHSSHEK